MEHPHPPTANLRLVQAEGEGWPIVCVHGDEANQQLPKHLGAANPFYAFVHQGADGRRIPYDRVERIAEQFIAELKAERPRGPYVLCGYSFGGLVAYEMAQRLSAQGDLVPLVVLLDTYAPHLHLQAMSIEAGWLSNLKRWLLLRMVEFALRSGFVLQGKLRHIHIIDTFDKATRVYQPGPYAGRLAVFKAAEAWGPEDMGWQPLAQGHLDLDMLPGDHYNMIKEPNVGAVAVRLKEHIARVVDLRAKAFPSHP